MCVVISPAEVKVIRSTQMSAQAEGPWAYGAREEEEGTFEGLRANLTDILTTQGEENENLCPRAILLLIIILCHQAGVGNKKIHFDFYTLVFITGTSSFA